jgi:hypothetical protein
MSQKKKLASRELREVLGDDGPPYDPYKVMPWLNRVGGALLIELDVLEEGFYRNNPPIPEPTEHDTQRMQRAAMMRTLILTEDLPAILIVEKAIGMTQAAAVDYILENSQAEPAPQFAGHRGTPAQRLAAARKTVAQPVFDASLLTPLENHLMFALAYVSAFIDDSTPEGLEAKALAERNLQDARAKGLRP